jgi:hypothetical protein
MTVEALEIEPGTGAGPARAVSRSTEPPGWLRFLAFGSAAGVLTFGLSGLILAVNGGYHPAPAFALGGATWVGVMAIGRPLWVQTGVVRRSAHVLAAAGLLAVLLVTAWNASHASQHVLINRDGGSYANTGRWIARDGSLEVDARRGPFADEPSLHFDSFAVYEMPNGRVQFQFSHLLPVVLAEAHAIGGERGFFRAPAVLGGIALLAFFVLAWRVTRRPALALAAVLALAFIVPQVSFARDSYSEIPTQIFVFSAAWCLMGARLLPGARAAFVAACFLGALEATRVDGISFLVGVPVLLAAGWATRRAHERRDGIRSIGAFALGLAPGLVVGLVDLTRHSGEYFGDLSERVRTLYVGVIAIAVASVLGVIAWQRLASRLSALLRGRFGQAAAGCVAIVTIGAGLAAWLIRPRVQVVRRGLPIGTIMGLQAAEGQAVDGTRRYIEYSMHWMWWYLGTVTLVAALVGAGLAAREVLLGRNRHVFVLACVIGPTSAMYLWNARAVPDHVWVTRRFLPGAFPLLILLAMFVAGGLLAVGGRWGRTARVAAVLVAALAVLHPLYTVRNVRDMAEQRRYFGIVEDACSTLGPDAAVVVIENERDRSAPLFDDWVPQALRSWCGADVAVMRGTPDAEPLRRVAERARALSLPAFAVAASPPTILDVLPTAQVTVTRRVDNDRLLEATLTRRPGAYRTQTFAMALARIPGGQPG